MLWESRGKLYPPFYPPIDLSPIFTNSFVFEGEDEEDLPSTASEWVFTTKSGNLASVVDLSFGVGLEILK